MRHEIAITLRHLVQFLPNFKGMTRVRLWTAYVHCKQKLQRHLVVRKCDVLYSSQVDLTSKAAWINKLMMLQCENVSFHLTVHPGRIAIRHQQEVVFTELGKLEKSSNLADSQRWWRLSFSSPFHWILQNGSTMPPVKFPCTFSSMHLKLGILMSDIKIYNKSLILNPTGSLPFWL